MDLHNHFLIAMPTLQDPIFKHSVIYVCEHNNNGTMGIIINKPTEKFNIKNILKNLNINHNNLNKITNSKYPIFSGGPLANDRGFILHTPCKKFISSINISKYIMITTSKDILETIGTEQEPNEILIALGYAGWAQGQLEYEIKKNDWLITQSNHEILFHTPVFSRWEEAAKILGINIYNITNQSGHA